MGVTIAAVLAIVLAAGAVVAARRHLHFGLPRDLLDRISRQRPRRPQVTDQEFRDRRLALFTRIARTVLAISDPPAGEMLHLIVRINPADEDLVGHDVIGDDRELGRLLVSHGRATRVTVRELHLDRTILRGHADVALVRKVGHVPATRNADEAGTKAPDGARLVRIGSEDEIAIPPGGGVIGRDAKACHIVVDAPTVSRRHAHLRPCPNGFAVEDLGSANGLTINCRRTELGELQHGDILGLGKTVRLRLEVPDR